MNIKTQNNTEFVSNSVPISRQASNRMARTIVDVSVVLLVSDELTQLDNRIHRRLYDLVSM